MAQSGKEAAIFRLVAKCLNQLRYHVTHAQIMLLLLQ